MTLIEFLENELENRQCGVDPDYVTNAEKALDDACYTRDALEEGRSLALDVVATWESGDLAGAVNALREWAAGPASVALAKAGD